MARHRRGLAGHKDIAPSNFDRSARCIEAHFLQHLASSRLMHGADVHDLGGRFDAVAIDPVVSREEVAIETLTRIVGLEPDRDLEIVGLADVADIRLIA